MTDPRHPTPDPDPLAALAEFEAGPRTLPLAPDHQLYDRQLPELSDAILVALALEAERAWDAARLGGGDVVAASGPRTKFQLATSLRGLTETVRQMQSRARDAS
jgi:hypothetical protein